MATAQIITNQEELKKWMAAGSPGNFADWQQSVKSATPALPPTGYYADTQKQLSDVGSGILSGNLPDYYKDLGTEGGKSFEDMLGLVKTDVSKSVNEDIIRRGVSRGGLGASLTARKIGDVSIAARESERVRALNAKQSLLTTGIDTLSGVRSSSQNAEQFDKTLEYNKFLLDREQKAKKNSAISDILSSIVGTGANLYMNSQLTKALAGKTATTVASKALAAKTAATAASAASVSSSAPAVATALGQPVAASQTAAGAGAGMGAAALLAPVGLAALAYGTHEWADYGKQVTVDAAVKDISKGAATPDVTKKIISALGFSDGNFTVDNANAADGMAEAYRKMANGSGVETEKEEFMVKNGIITSDQFALYQKGIGWNDKAAMQKEYDRLVEMRNRPGNMAAAQLQPQIDVLAKNLGIKR